MSLGNLSVNEYWDASANKPKLISGKGINGQGYIVGTPGTTVLDGVSTWSAGDVVVFILDQWIKLNGVGGGAGLSPAGSDGDVQIKSGTSLAALSRSGGLSTDYLARDDTYKTIPAGGGTVTGGGLGFTFDTLAAVQAADIPTVGAGGPNWLATAGYYAAGDGGGWQMAVRVGSQPTNHPAYIQSHDGQYWELRAVNGEVNIKQFGARPMVDYTVMPTIGGSQDSYAAFVAADRFIRYVYQGNITLKVPDPGNFQPWFMGRTHSLNRCRYAIVGETWPGVIIRTPPYESGFIVGGEGGVGDFVYAGNGIYGFENPTFVGLRIIRTKGAPGEYNTYVCTNVGNADFGADTVLNSSANNPASTYTWGTSTWKFIKNVGPTSPYDWDATQNTDTFMLFDKLAMWSFWNGKSIPDDPSGGFNGDPSPDFNKWPNQDLDPSGTPQYRFGIALRTRCVLGLISCSQYNGFGLGIFGNGDPECPNMTGNADGYEIRHYLGYYNGKAGIHVNGSIANAGNAYYVDTNGNGRAGIEDWSFLGNNWYGIQSATDGVIFNGPKQYLSGATYNGFIFIPRLPILGVESTPAYINEEPGNPGNNAWIQWGGDGTATFGKKGTLTGSISGSTLTATATSLTTIAVGDMLSSDPTGPHVRPGTKIASLGTGTGGTGTYILDGATQTVSSTTITVMDHTFYYSDQFEPWSPTKRYEWGGPFGSNNANARCFWPGSYQEGGVNLAQPGPKDVVIGGMAQLVDTTRGAVVLDAGNVWSNLTAYQYWFPDGTRIRRATGTPGTNGIIQGEIRLRTDAASGQAWGHQWDGGTWRVMGTLS